MTKKEALRISIEKWNHIAIAKLKAHDDKYYAFIKDKGYNEYAGGCPLCSLYSGMLSNDNRCMNELDKCPLYEATGITCFNSESPYRSWLIAKTKTQAKDRAGRILKILKKAWEEQYETEI